MDEQVTYRQQVNFCGKPRCRKCRDGIGHGPYWYAYHVSADGRKERVYIGKNLPPGVTNAGSQDDRSAENSGGDKPDSATSAVSQHGSKSRPHSTTKLSSVSGGRPAASHSGNPVDQYGEIDALDRLLAAEPGNEGVLRRLVIALAQAKRRGEALRACQRFFNTLRAMRMTPSQETLALYEAVQRGDDLSQFPRQDDDTLPPSRRGGGGVD